MSDEQKGAYSIERRSYHVHVVFLRLALLPLLSVVLSLSVGVSRVTRAFVLVNDKKTQTKTLEQQLRL